MFDAADLQLVRLMRPGRDCTSSSLVKCSRHRDQWLGQRTLARAEASILSPLRYPGSKRRFAGYVRRALELNGLKPKVFVEPFAGGASVALQLLNDGLTTWRAGSRARP